MTLRQILEQQLGRKIAIIDEGWQRGNVRWGQSEALAAVTSHIKKWADHGCGMPDSPSEGLIGAPTARNLLSIIQNSRQMVDGEYGAGMATYFAWKLCQLAGSGVRKWGREDIVRGAQFYLRIERLHQRDLSIILVLIRYL